MNTRIDTLSLRFFVRVVEEETIAAAAQKENITAAAVSKRISDLEATVGMPLLVRTNKGVEPTAAGVELLLLGRRVLHELDQIPAQMRDFQSGVRGHVRVFGSTAAMTQFFPSEIADFLRAHPSVELQVEETTSLRAIRAVLENQADIAIFINMPSASGLETFAYRTDRLVAIVPPDHPLVDRVGVAFEDLLDSQFIGSSRDGAIHHAIAKAAGESERPVRQRIQVRTFESMSMMVSQGLGVAVLPEVVAQRHRQTFEIRVLPLREAWATREYRIGTRSLASLPTAAQLVLDHLRGARQHA